MIRLLCFFVFLSLQLHAVHPFFQATHAQPYHLSIGAVLFNEEGKIACHHFSEVFGHKDIYILMRESMEDGETPLQTLHRGLKEEFGATAEPLAPPRSGPGPLQVTLRKIYIHAIRDGRKTVEGRVNGGMFKNLSVGRTMRFFYFANTQDDVVCRVVRINQYPSFRKMVEMEDYRACVPEATSVDHAALLYERIPGYAEKAQQHGVLAIHIEKI